MATIQARTYDPGEHLSSFGGIPVTSYGPDTFINAARNEDGWTTTIGAGGEVARSRNRNRTGKVTFTLLATSPENDLLMQAALSDENSAEGIGEVFIKDNMGTTVVHASQAWITKIPDLVRGKTVGTVTWVLECPVLDLFNGGNIVPVALP